MKIFFPKEAIVEKRISITPDFLKKYIANGLQVSIEKNMGEHLGFLDDNFKELGAEIVERKKGFLEADIICSVNKLNEEDLTEIKENSLIVSFLDPFNDHELVESLRVKKISSISMELIPRTTRAQKMDALSSQANLGGYAAVLIASNILSKSFPMMMTAAGTISPSKVFVVGVGVAGLQAIATAKRLGAKVEAFDTRPVVEEQVKSLGARFVKIDIGETEETAQGYAKELSAEQINLQRAGMKKVCSSSDVIITTAQVFGRKAPVIITSDMIEGMQPGSVIVDMAVGTGGNVEGSVPDENLELNGITIVGNTNLPGEVAIHASQVYSANIFNLIDEFWDQKNSILEITTSDEILSGCLVTHKGEYVNSMVKERYS
ncbi:NAD(P) transhydrogenase subunit alpha [SAR86 cluster bacterium]|nr:NAD(P) transhydrogenase subunit alpha [SAR86 cluster bacterium]